MSVNVLRTRSVLIVALTIVSCLVACESHKSGDGAQRQSSTAGASTPSQPSTHQVTIRGMQYEIPEVTVRVGETVVWKNDDIFAHTVSAADQSFDSGLIQPGASWTYVAKTAGVHPYSCKPHPNMKARLVVQ
jgi:plastocyanin